MSTADKPSAQDPWHRLRRFTQARIAQGHAGHALRTSSHLEFQLAHAQARDAVHVPWEVDALADQVRRLGLEPVLLRTQVADRAQYLRRPDLGRRLDPSSLRDLEQRRRPGEDPRIALIVSDGLSSSALHRHGMAFLDALVAALKNLGLDLSTVYLAPNGRVALSDDIGEAVGAELSLIVIGERPGLSAPDSLGIYLTYRPRLGNSDAMRNCISNVRPPQGLSCEQAAERLTYLMGESLRRRISGVELKDDSGSASLGEGMGSLPDRS